MTVIQHSHVNSRWYTPVEYVEAGRKVLGDIDLDPASDLFGNERVKAKRFFSKEQDGLSQPWLEYGQTRTTIWMNPPGRKARRKGEPAGPEHRPLPKMFWERLLATRAQGYLSHAIVVAFSLEQFQTVQGDTPMVSLPFCVPSRRVAYDPPSGLAVCPPHASAFVYVPGQVDRTEQFEAVFSKFGVVRR